jgi:hypothetical protein
VAYCVSADGGSTPVWFALGVTPSVLIQLRSWDSRLPPTPSASMSSRTMPQERGGEVVSLDGAGTRRPVDSPLSTYGSPPRWRRA